MRRIADRVRYMDLVALVKRLGARPDKYDPHKWHTPQGIISINGLKFINWNTRVGGGGAIDLTMHLAGVDFKTAVRWLDQLTVTPQLQMCRGRPRNTLRLPRNDAGMIRRVCGYLSNTRGLPETVVERLIQSGNLYADARGNAVFLLLGKDKKPVGAELRGTSHINWKGMAPGSGKNLGYFAVRPLIFNVVILCESAIDAMSCFCLHPECMTVSTAGVTPNPKWLPDLCKSGSHIYCGFDADNVGDEMAKKMMRLHPYVKRCRPVCKDWNLMLMKSIHDKPHILPVINQTISKNLK